MGVSVIGTNGVFEDMQSEATWNEYGLCSVTYYYTGPYDSLDGQVGTSKNGLKLKSARKTRGEAGIGTIAVTYEGVSAQAGGGSTGSGTQTSSAPRYSCKISTFSSKIETHPDFKLFGGVAAAPLNGAWFDTTTKLFIGFRGTVQKSGNDTPTASLTQQYTGVSSYEEVGIIWEETTVHTSSDTISNSTSSGIASVGTVSTDVPGWSKIGINIGNRNWLFMGADLDQLGYGYKVVKKWRLSGIGGWDSTIYKAAPTKSGK